MLEDKKNFFDLQTAMEELKKRKIGGMHIAVAVDGSQISDRAAQVASELAELELSHSDSAILLHEPRSSILRCETRRQADGVAHQRQDKAGQAAEESAAAANKEPLQGLCAQHVDAKIILSPCAAGHGRHCADADGVAVPREGRGTEHVRGPDKDGCKVQG